MKIFTKKSHTPEHADKLLTLKNLHAWYTPGKEVLSGVSLDLDANEVVGLIGLNGAGKTTFLKTVSGLIDHFQVETAVWNGSSVSFRDQAFKKCRYTVFAEDRSFQYFTFREYISYAAAAYGKKLPELTELIRGFHFEEYTDVLLRELSTGNRKKAYLITAFALRLELLLLDEPVNGWTSRARNTFTG